MKIDIDLPKTIGGGYATFWNYKGREIDLMGSRASKKSKTTVLRWSFLLKQYPLANLLVVRKVKDSIKDSCFADLKWAMNRLGFLSEWNFTTNPLQAVNIYTGQKILFRGLDDPLKVTSVAVEKGVLCWLWLEEAYEIELEEDFDKIDECIRGEVPEGYFKQAVITFNPWSDQHWAVKRIVRHLTPNEQILEEKGKQQFQLEDKLLMITNYKLNEFLDSATVHRNTENQVNDIEK